MYMARNFQGAKVFAINLWISTKFTLQKIPPPPPPPIVEPPYNGASEIK